MGQRKKKHISPARALTAKLVRRRPIGQKAAGDREVGAVGRRRRPRGPVSGGSGDGRLWLPGEQQRRLRSRPEEGEERRRQREEQGGQHHRQEEQEERQRRQRGQHQRREQRRPAQEISVGT